MPVSDKEQQEINSLVGRFEAATGIQAVAAVVGKSDAYPEIPWKAYAIGSALGASSVLLPFTPLTNWSALPTSAVMALYAMWILGGGALLALLAAFMPSVGRLFVDRLRTQAEARQYAQAMFLEREIFRTAERRAFLVLLSKFERTAVIIADQGLAACAPPAELDRIATQMLPALAARGPVAAFEIAFDHLKTMLEASAAVSAACATNELGDAVVTEKGL